MKIKNFTIVLVAVTALVAGAAGCGGGDNTLTKAQVIERGSAICKASETRVKKLPQLTTQHPFAKGTSPAERKGARNFLTGYADALESSRTGLEKLKAPAPDRQLLDGYIRDIGTVVDKLRAASTAPAQKVEDEANGAFALFAKASKQTAEYGFPKGICGSGSSN